MSENLNEYDLSGKQVLLRADLNVPIQNGIIVDEYRLLQVLPTINLILKKGGNIVLITHIGRPEKPSPELSTQQLIPWFEKQGYDITYAPTIEDAHEKIDEGKHLVLLENLRFFPGEQRKNKEFAQKLSTLGDYYVNDAFATMHRDDASITLVPHYFPAEKRTIGLLVHKESEQLNKLLHNPTHPFALIIGGGKIQTKLPLLFNLIENIDMLFLCPAVVFSFLKAQGEPVGKSLVDNTSLDHCKEILHTAQAQNVKVFFPIDYQIAMNTFQGPLSYVPANEIPDNGVGISIGPQTVDLFTRELNKAKTILYNGLMGDVGRPETIKSACGLFHAITQTNATTIVAGGDSVAAARMCEKIDNFTLSSSGGGAVIAYLSGEKLPGLEALE